MTALVRVALLGFSNFERTALSTCLRLGVGRVPHYVQVTDPEQAECLVADADHAPSVQLVQVTERVADTVFIGAEPPDEARAWMARPIDPLHVMRELDAMVAQRAAGPPPAALRPPPAPPAPSALRAPALPPVPVMPRPMPPVMPPVTPREAKRARRRQQSGSAPERHALLVDDSAIATLFLQKRLQPFGLHITTASSSGRATLLMSQQHFNFVFLDVELGEDSAVDGLTLCQQIRRHPVPAGAQPPVVVMVTAHDRELDRVRGTLAGCDAYLAKPRQQAELDQFMSRHGVEPALPAAATGS